MKVLGLLMMVLLLFSATRLQDVRADETEEAYKIGLKFYTGDSVPKDYAEALKWFQKAAERGDAGAQHSVSG